MAGVIVHLVDGTFELFRYFLSPAATFDRSAPEALRAVRGVVGSVLGMLEGGSTHLGVATDHVIESFRNALWPGYKTGEGIDPILYAQFQPLEEALTRARGGRLAHGGVRGRRRAGRRGGHGRRRCARRPGRRLLPGQGSGAMRARGPDRAARSAHPRAAERGGGAAEIWCASRLDSRLAGAGGRQAPTGTPACPAGARRPRRRCSRRYRHLDHIPPLAKDWQVSVRGALRLATTLAEQRERALLFRELARLRTAAPIGVDVDALRWRGPARRLRDLGGAARRAPAWTRVRWRCAARAAASLERARRAESLPAWPPGPARPATGSVRPCRIRGRRFMWQSAGALSCRHAGHRPHDPVPGVGTP